MEGSGAVSRFKYEPSIDGSLIVDNPWVMGDALNENAVFNVEDGI